MKQDAAISMGVLFHAAWETARISLPTVWEARRGTLSQEVCDERLRSWSNRLLQRVGVQLHVDGLQHLKQAAGPFVIVSNHESHYDIPCLYAAVPLSIRMAAKKELFKTPIWGPALQASGFVEINRSSPSEAYRALHAAGQLMKQKHVSLYIAPEGTRSVDGKLGRFKKGAFEVARAADLPVLPVALRGTRFIHKKGDRHVNPGCSVRVTILEPLFPANHPTSIDMAEVARQRIQNALRS